MRVVHSTLFILALCFAGQSTGFMSAIKDAEAISVSRGVSTSAMRTTRVATSSKTTTSSRVNHSSVPTNPTHSTAYQTSSGVWLPLMVGMMVMSNDGEAREVEADTPFLTACTATQFNAALEWQESCEESEAVNETYCPILSYFRHCESITPEEAQELKLLKDDYRNVYFRE